MLTSLKYLLFGETHIYYYYWGVFVQFPWAQADSCIALCHLSLYTRFVNLGNNFNKKNLHEITLWEEKKKNSSGFCMCNSVSLFIYLFLSTFFFFFFFNFGCERYLMYQKQFVQALFHQLKVCTPCWGLPYLTVANTFSCCALMASFYSWRDHPLHAVLEMGPSSL